MIYLHRRRIFLHFLFHFFPFDNLIYSFKNYQQQHRVDQRIIHSRILKESSLDRFYEKHFEDQVQPENYTGRYSASIVGTRKHEQRVPSRSPRASWPTYGRQRWRPGVRASVGERADSIGLADTTRLFPFVRGRYLVRSGTRAKEPRLPGGIRSERQRRTRAALFTHRARILGVGEPARSIGRRRSPVARARPVENATDVG